MRSLAITRYPSNVKDALMIYYKWDSGISPVLHNKAGMLAEFNQGYPEGFLIQSRDLSLLQIQ